MTQHHRQRATAAAAAAAAATAAAAAATAAAAAATAAAAAAKERCSQLEKENADLKLKQKDIEARIPHPGFAPGLISVPNRVRYQGLSCSSVSALCTVRGSLLQPVQTRE